MSSHSTHRKNQVSICNQHVFTESRPCLTDLISFYSKDDIKPICVVYLDFSKALDTFSQYYPGKTAQDLDRRTLLGEKLAVQPDSESTSEWHSTGASFV